MQAVNLGDWEGVLALYDPRAVLIPTFSSRVLNTPAKIRDYFMRLSEREELSLALHEKTIVGQALPNGLHVLSGIYNWRFSYVLDPFQPAPIVHHHSSQIPRAL